MPKVRVWNDNVHPYREQFREKLIEIPAKGFVEMERDEAIVFKGTYAPIEVDGDGQPLQKSYKRIRLEKVDGTQAQAAPPASEHVCQACKYKAASAKDLDEHTMATHMEQLEDREAASKQMQKSRAKAG